MKRSLVNILKCPETGVTDWEIISVTENDVEIRVGEIRSKSTGKSYLIQDGILDMIDKDSMPAEVAHEKEHAEAHSYIKTSDGNEFPINKDTLSQFKDVILSLPAGDGSSLFQPGGSFDNQGANAERFFKTIELLNLTGKEKVLEVGASFGWGCWRFAQRGCDVVGLEVSNYLLAADIYFEKDGSYFERMMGDMNHLPFTDNSFDIVFSHSVIHHCKEIDKLFAEFFRVLKPGGRVVALHECSFGLLEDKSGHALQEAIDEGFNENAYTVPQWKKGALDGGFKKFDTHFFSFIDDYIYRKELRKTKETTKLKLARWVKKHERLNQFVNTLSVPLRILFRPKAWMLIATK